MASKQQTRPGVRELAKDTGSGRIGVVMGKVGGRVQMRPVGGGVEWDARPDNVVTPSEQEKLTVRPAITSSDGRNGL
ncbi:hypothetical protein AB0D11_40515 [Streptomyces monashensis]|uniref:hypothetical protein n=1 Tax=Streptomyces monashensis TaxID=1678012 RepID=UPI0033C4801D